MRGKLFDTRFLHAKCYWMARTHPDHPCHAPHLGEMYCLYGKEDNWGYALFNVVPLGDITVVRSMYHIRRDIEAFTVMNVPMPEMGFIVVKGGRITYEGLEMVELKRMQFSFSYHPVLRCKVKLEKGYTETVDLYPSVAYLERVRQGNEDILDPFFEAFEQGSAYNPLEFSPFILNIRNGQLLMKIRNALREKASLSALTSFHLRENVSTLFLAILEEERRLAFSRLSQEQKQQLFRVESNPLECFDLLPGMAELRQFTGISQRYLKQVFRERHQMDPEAFIQAAWLKEACRLLRTTQESVQTIAYRLGWESPVSFNRVFKEFMGCPPSVYRRNGK